MSGLSVYNFGVGGYGILHYKHVFEMVRAKSPHIIILGLYLPNDLSDVCKLVGLQYWRQYLRENDFPPDFCPRPPRSRITYVDAIRTVLSNIAIVSALKHFVIDSTQKTDAQSTGAGAAAVTVRYGTRQTEISIPLVRSHRAGMDLSSPVIAQAHRIALLVLTEMIERSW